MCPTATSCTSVFLIRGSQDTWLKDIYTESYDAVLKHVYRRHPSSGLYYVPTYDNGRIGTSQEHLACFTGGMFALASSYETDTENKVS